MPFVRPIRHPELDHTYTPGSWELSHTAAEIDRLERAETDPASLTQEDKEDLIKMFGPLFGKTLADPSSLTLEERRAVVGWPDQVTRKKNLEAAGLGETTAEALLEKIVKDDSAAWMTAEQAHLVLHRFNARPLEEIKWPYVKERGRRAAANKVETKEERYAYATASAHFKELKGISHAQQMAKRRRIAEQKQEAAQKEFEIRNAEGRLTDLERIMLETEEEHKVAGQQEQIDCDTLFGTNQFGFYIYKAAELHALLAEYVADEANRDESGEPPQEKRQYLRTLNKLWLRFLKHKIFDDPQDGEGEFEVIHRAVTGKQGRHPAQRLARCWTRKLEPPAADAGACREDHRTRRARAAGKEDWIDGFNPRYFLVMDREGFPPIDTIIYFDKVPLAEVWVYDADWEPPSDGDGIRDSDGYEGRLRVRFAYNLYIHFYPLTLQEGFDMKKLWLEQVNHNTPYPFPGHDITYDNLRERVPFEGGNIPQDVWLQFAAAVAEDRGLPVQPEEQAPSSCVLC
ncbi:hypothetical protein E8E14_006638 [Neopestalotiopsis sp. 37M]|nr:hypothetical protein E8E14_006638 [Neopestalotiopsis sp. 37M]